METMLALLCRSGNNVRRLFYCYSHSNARASRPVSRTELLIINVLHAGQSSVRPRDRYHAPQYTATFGSVPQSRYVGRSSKRLPLTVFPRVFFFFFNDNFPITRARTRCRFIRRQYRHQLMIALTGGPRQHLHNATAGHRAVSSRRQSGWPARVSARAFVTIAR